MGILLLLGINIFFLTKSLVFSSTSSTLLLQKGSYNWKKVNSEQLELKKASKGTYWRGK